jgi:hypothetical protein
MLDCVTIGDLTAGSGQQLHFWIKAGINPNNAYYNDIDPKKVGRFRKWNKKHKIGIPDENITCFDAIEYKERMPHVEFDIGIGNGPFNESKNKTKNGTGGNATLYKNICQSYPIKPGGLLVQVTPKGYINDLTDKKKYPNLNLIAANMMTEKDYWEYNTMFWVARVEENESSPIILDKIAEKVFCYTNMLTGDWWEINGNTNEKFINNGNESVEAIVELKSKDKDEVVELVDVNYSKLLYGWKFCATLLENKTTYTVTNKPVASKFTGSIPVEKKEHAEAIQLFLENSVLLKALNKRLKFKGEFWCMRWLKPINWDQIKDGTEIPKEWNLTDVDLHELGVL